MIESKNDASKNLEKALQALEQAKQRVANEKKKHLFAPIQATYKECQSLKGLAKMRYDKEHTDSLSKYAELKERMQRQSATTERTLRGSFRTRANSITGNRAGLSGGRKKFNVNFIVKTGVFLYN